MDARQSLALSSLQDLCVYSLVGRLEEYSTQSLSLIPTSLRRQLLVLLPVADIVRIENDPVFTEGLDPDSVWHGLFDNRFIIDEDSPFQEESIVDQGIARYSSAKDFYLTEVAHNMLTSKLGCWYEIPKNKECSNNMDTIKYLLYGVRVVGAKVCMPGSLYTVYNSMGIKWVVPNRYHDIFSLVQNPSDVFKIFLNTINWYPKRIDLDQRDNFHDVYSFPKCNAFEMFVSRAEIVELMNEDYENDMFADSIQPLWDAIACSKSPVLHTVILSACVTNLASSIDGMLSGIFKSAKDGQKRVSSLQRIEFLGNDGDSDPHKDRVGGLVSSSIIDSIPFIDYQVDLETLIVECMLNIARVEDSDNERYDDYVSMFDGFEPFYNFLPYFISKPSFKLLRLVKCNIPLNSIKSMMAMFLSAPTDHEQRLEFVDYNVVESSTEVHSEKYPLFNDELYSPCVSGQHKSLRCNTSSPFSTKWLFEYPNLKLKRLDLHYQGFTASDLNASESYRKGSIDNLSYHIHVIGNNECECEAIFKLLQLEIVSEIELYNIHESLISVITKALVSHKIRNLKRIHLKQVYDDTIDMKAFFDALFSLPKDHLADLAVEIIEVSGLKQQEIVDSWRANSRGQKLKLFNVTVKLLCDCVRWIPCKNRTPLGLPELSDIASIVNVD